jgi:hypothetical protein
MRVACVPSGPGAILRRMAELSDQRPNAGTFEPFAKCWFTPLVGVFLRPPSRRLSVAQQRQITALAEEHIELPVSARNAADALARMAPPPHVLAELRLSGLVEADPLPDHERDPHGN